MQASGLFEDKRIPQVQGVAYLHKWNDYDKRRGGFYLFDKGTHNPHTTVPDVHNTAIICDGTIMVHGTETYMETDIPPLDKNNTYEIKYKENQQWVLYKNGVEHKQYHENDLRITLVWRQHCFKDLDEKNKFNDEEIKGSGKRFELKEILETFQNDLLTNKVVEKFPDDPTEIMSLLIHHYINYPYPRKSIFP